MAVIVKGVKETLMNINRVSGKYKQATDRGVVATASEIQREAILSINKQSQGKKYKRGNVTHVASKPGDAPNTDKGRLVQSISISHTKGAMVAYVYTDLDYGAYLELVKDRPWLKPAMEAKSGELKSNIAVEMAKIA